MAEYPIWEQVNNNAGTTAKPVVGSAVIASAATIAPTFRVTHVSGVAAISTITLPWSDFGGTLVFIADGAFSWGTGGNIQVAGSTSVGQMVFATYDPVNAKWYLANGGTVNGGGSGGGTLFSVRTRTTTANVNLGATLLPAVAGLKYRLTEAVMISIGGAAATATTVDIKGTQSAASVKLVAAAVATLTQDAIVKMTTANTLAAGASYVQNDVNTAITIGSTTNNLATSTNIDTILTFALEP
jgi:hypothetical protein